MDKYFHFGTDTIGPEITMGHCTQWPPQPLAWLSALVGTCATHLNWSLLRYCFCGTKPVTATAFGAEPVTTPVVGTEQLSQLAPLSMTWILMLTWAWPVNCISTQKIHYSVLNIKQASVSSMAFGLWPLVFGLWPPASCHVRSYTIICSHSYWRIWLEASVEKMRGYSNWSN